MKQFSLKNLQVIHFTLLITVVFLFTFIRLILDSEDFLLKIISICSSLIGSMWGLILILITLLKDKANGEQNFLLSFYRKLLINTKFLIISNFTFLIVALGLFTFLAIFQVVEFRTHESEIEVFLSNNELKLQEPNYKSLGIITPEKPLKKRLLVGKKRFSFESLSGNKEKDAKIIHLKPFKIGNNYVYNVKLH